METGRMMAVKDAVHKVQLSLLEGIQDENQLLAAGSLMCCSDYQDVVTERTIARKCGYPLCSNALPVEQARKGRYRISLKEHKVYDLQETYSYCSTSCVVNSRAFAGSLADERSSELNPAKLTEVLRVFEGLSPGSKEDPRKNGHLRPSKLSIQEKTNATKEVSFEEWLGPSGAIEGYVPQTEHRSKPQHREKYEEGSNSKFKHAHPKNENHIIFNDMDFTSTFITQDEYTVSKSSSSTNTASSQTSNAREEHYKHTKGLAKPLYEPEMSVGSSSDGKPQESNKLNGKVVGIDDLRFSELTFASGEEALKGKGSEVNEQVHTGKVSESDVAGLKSSLKSSDSTRLNRTVTWADEKTEGSISSLCEYEAGDKTKTYGPATEGNENSYRLASAGACAEALMQVADVVASGKSDVSGAVSEVGLIILPPPQELDGSMPPQMDDDNEDSANLFSSKWPSKLGEPNYDLFDSDDSWFDGPPNGFRIELSPFATMFTALFAWISSSSLAYIYGRDESFHKDYLSVNGRDYPIKVVASDGRSFEIRQTLAGCLSRALPGVVRDFRLPTPVSTLEQGMARFLDTMSFIDPLPALRMKQWQVIVLLFLDALSVSRIPPLTPYMTGRRVLLPKVLDGASINAEEYEIMKDLIIPLGRIPQFSSQCGG